MKIQEVLSADAEYVLMGGMEGIRAYDEAESEAVRAENAAYWYAFAGIYERNDEASEEMEREERMYGTFGELMRG